MDLCGRGAECRRDAGAGGHVRRIDTVAGQERLHERVATVDTGLAEHIRCAEGQDGAHSGRERGERPRLCAQVRVCLVVHGNAHDDAAAVLEFGDRTVVAPRRAFAEDAHLRHLDAGQGRGHRRG